MEGVEEVAIVALISNQDQFSNTLKESDLSLLKHILD